MESLHINGHSIKFVDRKLMRRDSFESKLNLSQKLFVPFSLDAEQIASGNESDAKGRKCPKVIEVKAHKRRILKRPRKFKNYYTDRQPLSIPSFSFPRLGEPKPFRGRQTLCKYYDGNEIINDELIRIKSATTVRDFEKVFSDQLRHKRGFSKSARSIEPYYDTKAILAPLKPFTSETCLCTRETFYRLDYKPSKERQVSSPVSSLNAIKPSSPLDNFLHLASECYDACIQYYLNNLNECNKKAASIERQSSPAGERRQTLRASRKLNEFSLVHRLQELKIDLKSSSICVGQSISYRDMSCNDTNNNSTDSTNQLKDPPPKIKVSDYSSTKQSTQGDSDKVIYSDNSSAIDNNYLKIPITEYSSEARPP